MTTHKAKYFIPGLLFSEETTRILEARDPTEAAAKAPRSAFAFELYDVEEPDFDYDRERFDVVPKRQNVSGRYYLGGEVLTVAELKERFGDDPAHRILIANIEGSYPAAIRCRTGNWQPFEDGDTLLEVDDAGGGTKS